jgi:hypothetical protein
LGFKALCPDPGFAAACVEPLISLAELLARLWRETGRTIRLAIEPEPCCVLETTAETLQFFKRLRDAATQRGLADVVEEHLGVCYDVCHQAVEFEDVAASIRALQADGVRINKVHISCAIDVSEPCRSPERLAALRRYIEPRYLHQTFAAVVGGTVSQLDLNASLLDAPPAAFRDAAAWRVHFHVPVHAESLGPLGTTRPDLVRALAVLPELPYAPHLEVETYTWEVLPDGGRTAMVDGLARELQATHQLLYGATATETTSR